jgi:hypothetical protein
MSPVCCLCLEGVSGSQTRSIPGLFLRLVLVLVLVLRNCAVTVTVSSKQMTTATSLTVTCPRTPNSFCTLEMGAKCDHFD